MKKCIVWLALMLLCGFIVVVAAVTAQDEPIAQAEPAMQIKPPIEESVRLSSVSEEAAQTETETNSYLTDWPQDTEVEYYEDTVWMPDTVSEYAGTYGTIMVVDLANQHAYCCVDGAIIADADCVSGDFYNSPTPTGLYSIWYKCSDFYMLDTYYSAYAVFFNGDIAIHDADAWRSEYGGSIYQWSGSHGCINTPRWFAEIVYNNTEIGTPVYVY